MELKMIQAFDNVTHKEDLKDKLDSVFAQLGDILIQHAGPFATNSVISSRWRQMNDVDEFTKDGIKILNHLIVDDDPIARFAVRMTRFIGIAVDRRCHDGTTTSMLLFSRLAREAIEMMDESLTNKKRYLWWHDFVNVCKVCLDIVDDLKITEEDFLEKAKSLGIETTSADVRGAIAYHMAMISSKGDHDLAEKISRVIKHSPKKIYGMYKTGTLPFETEERFILKKQEYDLSVGANLGNRQDYNYRNDTQYMSEDSVIFATGNDIVTNSMESVFLTALISKNPKYRQNLTSDFGVEKGWEDLHQGKKRLIIISPMMNDPNLLTEIMMFNMSNPNIKISNFNIQVNHQVRSSFNKTLHYMCGVPIFQDVIEHADQSLIGLDRDGVKVHLVGNILTFHNLYDKTGDVYHPFYSNPNAFESYTKFCEETEELIAFVLKNVTNPALDGEDLNHLISLYRTLTCQEIYDIDIGGCIHEQYANSTVYEDAVGAALSAVEDGVVLGGYGHLARLLEVSDDQLETAFGDEIISRFVHAFKLIVADSIRVDVEDIETRLELLENKWDFIVADKAKYIQTPTGDRSSHVSVKSFDETLMRAFLDCDKTNPILLQAWSGYHEQFKRMKDILPMLSNTTNLADQRTKDANSLK